MQRTNTAFVTILCFLLTATFEADAQLYINEVMASNSTTLADEDGDYEDWIEIYNSSDEPVEMTGYWLSDDASQPLMWAFPNVTIPGKGFLLVWASGKNRHGSVLHTNFRISMSGEDIILTSPLGNQIDIIPSIHIPTDVSYGRKPDGSSNLRYFYQPTPATSNTTEGLTELVTAPSFSKQPGWYNSTFNLDINANLETGGKILYTLDGSEPNINNIGNGTGFLVNYYYPNELNPPNIQRHNKTYEYTEPITITSNPTKEYELSDIITTYYNAPEILWAPPRGEVFKGTTIKAKVHYETAQSETITASYLVDPLGNERYTLPTVSFTIDPRHLVGYNQGIYVPGRQYFDNGGTETQYPDDDYGNFFLEGVDWEKQINMQLFNTEGELEFDQNIGMRIHGGSLQRKPLKPFRLYSRDDYDDGTDMRYPFIPTATNYATGGIVDTYQRLLIRASGNLMDHLYDVTAPMLMEPSSIGIQHSQPIIHLFNGEYWGIIYMRDRFDRYHIANTYGLDSDNVIIIDSPIGRGQPEDVDEGSDSDLALYRQLYDHAINNNLSNTSNYNQIESMLDVMSYIDYYAMFITLNNWDWFGRKHFRLWRARETSGKPFHDGRWRLLAWDFDVYGELEHVDYNLLADALHPDGGGGEFKFDNDPNRTRLIVNLLENQQFRNLFINRFADIMNTLLHPSRFEDIIEQEYATIEAELQEHYNRWGIHATTRATVDELVTFGQQRPTHIRSHLMQQFGLNGVVNLSLSVSGASHGHIKVNTVDINSTTAGVKDQPYPWNGIYFLGVPIELEAIPAPGYRFVKWEGLPSGETATTNHTFSENEASVKAVFESTGEATTIHGWHFNNLPDGILTSILPDETILEGASISYPGSGDGYMDDVNDGTSMNALEGIPAGRALRVRNPSDTRELILELPTTGYNNLELSYATKRTNNGAQYQSIHYRTSPDDLWMELKKDIEIDTDYKQVEVSIQGIEEANSNPDFAIRISFSGSNASGTDGNNRFDNVTLAGVATGENTTPILPPQASQLDASYRQGAIHLYNPYPTPSALQVFDTNGRLVTSQAPLQYGHQAIPFASQPGIYIVRIVSSKHVASGRVLVIK